MMYVHHLQLIVSYE